MSAYESTNVAVLSTRGLAKTYVLGFFRKKVRAVTDVSLEVRRGEIFGLLGPNGAGKTTTIKILMGLIRPSSGTAEVLGRPVGKLESKRRLGYLPETPYFYEYLTGEELLVFFGELFGLGRRESRRRAQLLLERVGLTGAAKMALRRYSKGMLQRVGLAQALINEPELVVLDEPLTGLDPLGRKHLRDVILELRQEGKTVLLSSHILSDVEMLADRVAIVVNGRTVECGPPDQLVDARVLSIEVLVNQPPPPLLQALEAAGHAYEQVGETVRVDLDRDADVDAVVDLVRSKQGRIVSVTPRKESLEDVVVRRTRMAGSTDQRVAPVGG